jgi:hypothetical protein
MSQWVINRGDSQFRAESLIELIQLAKQGELDAGDLVQPEGADDWLYAIEIPELAGVVKIPSDDDDIEYRRGGAGALKLVGYIVFSAMLLGGAAGMVYFAGQMPTGDEALLGEGGSLRYTDLITLTDASLFSTADEKSSVLTVIPKDGTAELLAKRGGFYKARYQGKEGWLRVEDILPIYQLGNDKVKRKLDPLYNPDQYTKVTSASFVQIDEDGNDVGTFRFMLENSSDYDVTDIRLRAVIKDSKGAEVTTQELAIEGVIPARGGTMVGTLPPSDAEVKAAQRAGEEPPAARTVTYASMERYAKTLSEEEQEEIYLRWIDGIDIKVDETFTEAEVRIVELRAIPQ